MRWISTSLAASWRAITARVGAGKAVLGPPRNASRMRVEKRASDGGAGWRSVVSGMGGPAVKVLPRQAADARRTGRSFSRRSLRRGSGDAEAARRRPRAADTAGEDFASGRRRLHGASFALRSRSSVEAPNGRGGLASRSTGRRPRQLRRKPDACQAGRIVSLANGTGFGRPVKRIGVRRAAWWRGRRRDRRSRHVRPAASTPHASALRRAGPAARGLGHGRPTPSRSAASRSASARAPPSRCGRTASRSSAWRSTGSSTVSTGRSPGARDRPRSAPSSILRSIFVFYASVPLAFALSDPDRNALPAAALLFGFMGTASSFLAFAAVAAPRGLVSQAFPDKGLFYLGGLTEGRRDHRVPGRDVPEAGLVSGARLHLRGPVRDHHRHPVGGGLAGVLVSLSQVGAPRRTPALRRCRPPHPGRRTWRNEDG